jgi:hypothetical protein
MINGRYILKRDERCVHGTIPEFSQRYCGKSRNIQTVPLRNSKRAPLEYKSEFVSPGSTSSTKIYGDITSTPQHVLTALCLTRHKDKFIVLIINLTPAVNSTGSHISRINVHTINFPCFLPYLFPVLHLTTSHIRQLQTGQKDLIFDIQQPTTINRFQGNAVKVSRIWETCINIPSSQTFTFYFCAFCTDFVYRVFKKRLGPMHTFFWGPKRWKREKIEVPTNVQHEL